MSSESPRATADLSESEREQTGTAAQAAGRPGEPLRTSQGGAGQPSGAPARNGAPPPAGSHAPDAHANASDFGANQWLVDELYQRYLADPGSVDPAWWSFFADYRPTGPAGEDQPARSDSQTTATAASAPAGTGPAPAGTMAPPAPSTAPTSPRPAAPGPVRPQPPAPQPAVDGEHSRLRGAAARTAANMAGSLAVPTATSVRDVPAKLLIDNRIVVNNHLRRGRGGKVSFTHLIGYAVVRALRAIPAMNESYAEEDGKPVLVTPEHVNLGLAIDVAKSDGTRQLLVPNIKAAEAMDFRQFWIAYEDLIRKARAGKLEVDDFAGVTISLTNPGTIGTVHSVPRLMPARAASSGSARWSTRRRSRARPRRR